MEGDLIYINKKLRPLSWLYGLGVGFRNMLFEAGILKSHTYATPVISVGNITVGGTGKTPHVEYLIRLLKDKTNLAVLSRGYKRKSRGFLLADNDSTMYDIGDEPFQIKQKFPDITVAVDKKRTRGISRLINGEAGKDIDVILLDDAFQHRYVRAGISILLVDYHRLIIYDELLPSGRLREPVGSKDRADIVIVTKCPPDIKPMDYRVITKAMALYPYQQLYFSTHEYKPRQPRKPRQPKKPSPLPRPSVDRYRLAGTDETRPGAVCQGDPSISLRRPLSVQGEGYSEDQRHIQQSPLAQVHHHHRERCRAPENRRGTERRGAATPLCIAYPHQVTTRPGGII